jgi:cytochrome c oxidase cbb3-type subunit 1
MDAADKNNLVESNDPFLVEDIDFEHKSKVAEIDASCRIPVATLFASAIFWLLAGTFFAMFASLKLTFPTMLSDFSFLDIGPITQRFTNELSGAFTFGRLRSAHLNSVIYGWASQAALGAGIWMMARLCHIRLRNPRFILGATMLWNFGMVIGVIAILGGQSTSIEWLEFPTYAAFPIFLGFGLVSIWAVIMFRFRKPGHVYVSQWYILGALFWFPWLYGTANILLLMQPVQGTLQAIVNWWYGHNVLGLWFTPIGLAAAYYLIPKVTGKPIYSYYLSILGFWSLALFYSWNGMHHLIGGPIPVWLQSASVVASVMMLIPVITVAINHHMTMKGHFGALKYSPTLRFTVFGAMSYTVASLQGTSMAIPSLNKITHFTHYTIGHSHLGLYAFFTMIMFGAIYYIMPRIVGWEWPSSKLIRIHFWCTAIGAGLMITTLTVGGLIQGLAMNDAEIPFNAVITYVQPFLHVRSLSGMLLTIGHIAFAVSFVALMLRMGDKRQGPTLFSKNAKPLKESNS